MPWFNGAKLDDIVDYLTYVFVPALFVWRARSCRLRGRCRSPRRCCCRAPTASTASDAKTADHFFTGFPSVLEHRRLLPAGRGLVVHRERRDPAGAGGAGVRAASATSTRRARRTGVCRRTWSGVVWGVLMLVMLWQYPAVSRHSFWCRWCFPFTTWCSHWSSTSAWLVRTPQREADRDSRVQSRPDHGRR